METLNSFNLSIKDIFDKHAKNLCLYALNYLKTEADAEDIVQDVFMRCWEKKKFYHQAKKWLKLIFSIPSETLVLTKLEKKTSCVTTLTWSNKKLLMKKQALLMKKSFKKSRMNLPKCQNRHKKSLLSFSCKTLNIKKLPTNCTSLSTRLRLYFATGSSIYVLISQSIWNY